MGAQRGGCPESPQLLPSPGLVNRVDTWPGCELWGLSCLAGDLHAPWGPVQEAQADVCA